MLRCSDNQSTVYSPYRKRIFLKYKRLIDGSETSDSAMEFSSSKTFMNQRFGGMWGKRVQNPKQIGSDAEAKFFGSRGSLSLCRSNGLVQKCHLCAFLFVCRFF